MSYRIVVTPAGKAGPHHLADASVVFESLAIEIVGFSIWRRRDGQPGKLAVTLPGKPVKAKPRPAKATEEGHASEAPDYFDFVRNAPRGADGVKRLKAEILKAFEAQCPGVALQASAPRAPSVAAS